MCVVVWSFGRVTSQWQSMKFPQRVWSQRSSKTKTFFKYFTRSGALPEQYNTSIISRCSSIGLYTDSWFPSRMEAGDNGNQLRTFRTIKTPLQCYRMTSWAIWATYKILLPTLCKTHCCVVWIVPLTRNSSKARVSIDLSTIPSPSGVRYTKIGCTNHWL